MLEKAKGLGIFIWVEYQLKWKVNVPNGRTKTSEENPPRKISQHIAMYYT